MKEGTVELFPLPAESHLVRQQEHNSFSSQDTLKWKRECWRWGCVWERVESIVFACNWQFIAHSNAINTGFGKAKIMEFISYLNWDLNFRPASIFTSLWVTRNCLLSLVHPRQNFPERQTTVHAANLWTRGGETLCSRTTWPCDLEPYLPPSGVWIISMFLLIQTFYIPLT